MLSSDRLTCIFKMAGPFGSGPGLSGISLAISAASIESASPGRPEPPEPTTATGDEIEVIVSDSDDSSSGEFNMSVILCTGKWASSQRSPRILWSKS